MIAHQKLAGMEVKPVSWNVRGLRLKIVLFY